MSIVQLQRTFAVNSRQPLMAAVLTLAALTTPALVQAQQGADYPSKLIRIIVPYAAGGPTDIYSRVVADHMAKRFGKPVIVDNRPGALAAIGHEAIARSEPDGHTIGLISSALTVLPVTSKSFTLNASRDFSAISQLIYADYSIAVHPSVPAENLRELIDYSKSNPDKVNFGSAGGQIDLVIASLGARAGVKWTVVPYKGAAPARVALIANQVQIVLESVGVARDLAAGGKARFVAVTGAQRNPAAPSIATVGESGLPGFEAGYFFGFGGPAGMPKDVVAKLYEAIASALQATELRKQILNAGNEPVGSTPEQFSKYLQEDTARWAAAARAAGIKPE